MNKDSAIKHNLDLLSEFMRCAFENPQLLERIPPEANLVILPIDDKELYEYNKRMAEKMYSQGKTVMLVRIKSPQPAYAELELMMTAAA
jgi:hypothetical protein